MTSFRTGGPAALLGRPGDAEELAGLASWASRNGLPFLVLGGGTNLLADDMGFRGLAAVLSGSFRKASYLDGGEGGRGASRILAGAGVRLSEVADMARAAGRSGWARLRGIPGTLGGALVMNAGANGTETGDLTVSVKVLPVTGAGVSGAAAEIGREGAGFRYRGSDLAAAGVVLGAELLLGDPAPEEEIRRLERETLDARRRRLPAEPSAGSVFRNPEGDSAGRLVDACGLKGRRIGGAVVSPRHANVIVNAGGATSSEVRALAALARHEVLRRFGTELEAEVLMLDTRGVPYP
ncbi:MAG: UDP-N-acetylmuramate dehydrogenase [Deltaproteobacteria bacterium]|nr:UDP-N-acetylmuramate dehydrogenase [Deltaproteobacteria bacterium]